MKTWIHFLVSLIIALFLYPFFGWKVLFILVGGVLIDIDHYFWYVFKFRKLNIIHCYKFFLERFDKIKIKELIGSLLIFHTVEFLAIMIIFSFFSEIIFFSLIGLISHYVLDLIFLYTVPKQLIANHSITSWIIKNKILNND